MSDPASPSPTPEVPDSTSSRQGLGAALRARRKPVIIGILVLVLAAGGYVARNLIVGNEHYRLGLTQLRAKNYDDAASEFRLCLEDEPVNARAKGMLAYAVLRQELAKESRPEEMKDRLQRAFVVYAAHLIVRDMGSRIKDEDARKWFGNRIKDAETEMKEAFKRKNIPFRDWDEFRQGMAAAAKEIFAIPIKDDDLDSFFKDLAATVLARAGDRAAAEYLVGRCASDRDKLILTMVAGQTVITAVRGEAQKGQSFIQAESGKVLQLLGLAPLIKQFVTDHPGARAMREGDFESDQRMMWEREINPSVRLRSSNETGANAERLFGHELGSMLELADASADTKFDPTSVWIERCETENEGAVVTIGGFDGNINKYVCRLYIWAGQEWQAVTPDNRVSGVVGTEFQTRYPFGRSVSYVDKKLCMALRQCRTTTSSRPETKTRTVVRERQGIRSNPITERLEYYPERYLDTETYTEMVPFTETQLGDVMRKFAIDAERKRLFFESEDWSPG